MVLVLASPSYEWNGLKDKNTTASKLDLGWFKNKSALWLSLHRDSPAFYRELSELCLRRHPRRCDMLPRRRRMSACDICLRLRLHLHPRFSGEVVWKKKKQNAWIRDSCVQKMLETAGLVFALRGTKASKHRHIHGCSRREPSGWRLVSAGNEDVGLFWSLEQKVIELYINIWTSVVISLSVLDSHGQTSWQHFSLKKNVASATLLAASGQLHNLLKKKYLCLMKCAFWIYVFHWFLSCSYSRSSPHTGCRHSSTSASSIRRLPRDVRRSSFCVPAFQ